PARQPTTRRLTPIDSSSLFDPPRDQGLQLSWCRTALSPVVAIPSSPISRIRGELVTAACGSPCVLKGLPVGVCIALRKLKDYLELLAEQANSSRMRPPKTPSCRVLEAVCHSDGHSL